MALPTLHPTRVDTPTASTTVIAAATVILFWASAFVGVRICLNDLAPGQLALARYAVAALVFAALALVRRLARPRPADLVRLAVAGAFGIAFYNVALNTGQQTVMAGVASLLINTGPLWTSFLAMILLNERLTRLAWTGALIAFAGIAIIGLTRSAGAGFDSGILLILTAALSQAVYFIILKPMLRRYHPIDLTTYCVWFGVLILLPYVEGLADALQQSSPMTRVAVMFLGIGPGALAYVAWSYVLAALPAGRASHLLFLVPVTTLVMGWLILGEQPAPVTLLGGGIAILGVLVSTHAPARPASGVPTRDGALSRVGPRSGP